MTGRARRLGGAILTLLVLAGVRSAVVAAAPLPALETTWPVFTVAGDGRSGDTAVGIAATATPAFATDVAATPDGELLFSSARGHRVFAVAPSGVLRVVAGDGSAAISGDGGPALTAGLGEVGAIAALPGGGFVLADGPAAAPGAVAAVHPRIRRVAADGTITTIAGGDVSGFAGDGGPATAALFGDVVALAARPDGSLLAVDAGAAHPANQLVRQIGPDGVVTTVAGTGRAGFSNDGGAATKADLQDPVDVSATADGGFLIADGLNHRIRRVSPAGVITTVAGDGQVGPGDDGRPAVATQLDGPLAVQAAPDGGFWIADLRRLRRVGADGIIRAVTGSTACRHDDIAGPGNAIFAGEGRQARCAAVVANALTATSDGGVAIADANRNVRVVAPAAGGYAAVAITSTAFLRASVGVNLRSTFAGTARLDVLQGGRVVTSAETAVAAGWATVLAPRPPRAGVSALRLTITGADGGTAVADVGVQLGALTSATARAALTAFFTQTAAVVPPPLGSCRRFSAARVDCTQVRRVADGHRRCVAVLSVQVRRSALAGFRVYPCASGRVAPFARTPHWNTAEWPQRWPPLLRRGLMPAPLLTA